MNEVVIWARREGRQIRVGCTAAVTAPLPFAAEAIARVPACDRNLMMRWVLDELQAGKTVAELKELCQCQ